MPAKPGGMTYTEIKAEKQAHDEAMAALPTPKPPFAPRRLTKHDEYTHNGVTFRKGQTVKLRDEPGMFVIHGVSVNHKSGHVWADAYGGTSGRESFRSLSISRLLPLDKKQTASVESKQSKQTEPGKGF
jgi:hypothetical protein